MKRAAAARRAWPAVLACVLAALGPAGCGGPARAAAPPSWVHAALSFQPDPPVARTRVAVRVTLTARDGRPLDGARVRLNAVMPGMYHPGSDFLLHPAGAGRYTGRVILIMGGSWVAELSIAAAGRTAQLSLPFTVRE